MVRPKRLSTYAHKTNWMMFVDGENLTLRAQKIAAKENVNLEAGKFYEPDVFVWAKGDFGNESTITDWHRVLDLGCGSVRSYYYTSVQGDDDELDRVRAALWEIGFQPEVFKKQKGQKSKGVDITLTKDLLLHAFHNHYDIAVLVAGDADYIPLINEVKRFGKIVCVAFFGEATPTHLRLCADFFTDIGKSFWETWKKRD